MYGFIKMSQVFSTPDMMIPHWTSPSTADKSVLGASYHAAAHTRIAPRLHQETLNTVAVQPSITGAVNTGAYRALVSLANRQAMNEAMMNEPNPWLSAPCDICSSTVAIAHNL